MASIPLTTVEELQAIDGFADGDEYHLANNIDASDTINWNGGEGFVPLTRLGARHSTSVLDGQGYKIKDLYIHRPTESGIGLFSNPPADVRNLVLDNLYLEGDGKVGGIAGRSCGDISECGVSGNVVGGGDSVGGLCGYVESVDTVSESYSIASIRATSISRGYGGLVGRNAGAVIDCYATGAVTGVSYILMCTGGLVGYNSTGVITRCYSVGKVLPVQGTSVTANGFIGYNAADGITASYWNTEKSGYTIGTYPDADPPTGKTTAQMKQQATFAGWDFDTVWKMIEGVKYPHLRWQSMVHVERICTIASEDRTAIIGAEDRSINIAEEDRLISIKAEDRTTIIKSEDRRVTIQR